ncbi:TonB-dependent receptor [Chitinophagaceae bacterium 26-R-25]|nr:TonB-dependent receptor [Chitinophagaceae bacterium 26-R-25]
MIKSCATALILLACSLFDMAHAAIVRGDVIEKGTGLPVAGATVAVAGESFITKADQNGSFLFHNLPEGNYNLQVSAAGYMSGSFVINAKNDKPVVVHMVLQPRVVELESVTVIDSVDHHSALYGRILERKSVPIVNIISKQSIELSADVTMADAMQRVSGVSLATDQTGAPTKAIIRGMDTKYSYTSVNGIALPSPDDRSRYIALDLFPAGIIERLETYKTLVPSMSADAIGGSMNIVTQQVPLQPVFMARMATGYSQIFFDRSFLTFNNGAVQKQSPYEKYGSSYYAKGNDFTKDNLSFNHVNPLPDARADVLWGRQFLKNKKLGVMAAAGVQNIKEGSNSFFIAQNSEPQLNNAPGITDFTQRQYSINSKRANFYMQAQYRINPRHLLLLTQLYTRKQDDEARYLVDTSLAEGRSGPGTGRIAISQRSRLHIQSLYHINLHGDHAWNDELFANWQLAYSTAYGSYPDWAELTANTGRIAGPDGQVQQTPVLLAPLNRYWLHNTERKKDLSLNITYTPKLFNQHIAFDGGTLLQFKRRDNFYNQYIFNPAYTEPKGQPFAGIYNATWYNDNGPQNPLGNTNTPGTYGAKENISAVYAQVAMRLRKVDVTAGIRNEHTYQLESSADKTDGEVQIKYNDWLPSMHIRYALSKQQNIRLSYYKAISRPALYDVTFFNMAYDDYNIAGNPFLQRSSADNIDLRYELQVPQILNVLQVTAFYKKIKNPYEKTLLNAGDTLYPIPEGGLSYTPAVKITEQLRNFASACNYGFELSGEKHFGNMAIGVNYTFTSSRITQSKKFKERENRQDPSSDIITVTKQQQRPLQGQSKHIGSINFSYRIPRIGSTVQVTAVYTGKRIEDVSGWYELDDWQKGYTMLNLSAEKTFHTHWRAFARAGNVLNAGRTVYINTSPVAGLPGQTEKNRLVIEKINNYSQYVVGIAYKL